MTGLPWGWNSHGDPHTHGNGNQIFPVGSPYDIPMWESPYGAPYGDPYDRSGGSKIKVVCQKFYRRGMQDLMAISVATLVGHLQFPHIQIGCYNNSEKK